MNDYNDLWNLDRQDYVALVTELRAELDAANKWVMDLGLVGIDGIKTSEAQAAEIARLTERCGILWSCLREMRRQRYVRITDQTVWCESVSRRIDRRNASNG